MKKITDKVQESSGNVFADLGISQPQETLAKAQIANRICELINERQLTQVAAAQVLEIDQPKVSALMCGRLQGFSLERLFRFLNCLGQDVEIAIKPQAFEGERGDVRILS